MVAEHEASEAEARVRQEEMEQRLELQEELLTQKQQSEQQAREIFAAVIPQDGTPIKRSDIVEQLTVKHPFQRTRCYELIKQALSTGWLEEVDRSRVRLKTAADDSSVRPL